MKISLKISGEVTDLLVFPGIFRNGSFRPLCWEQARPQVEQTTRKVLHLLAKGGFNAAAFYGSVLAHEGAHGLAITALFGDLTPQIKMNWRGEGLTISFVREGVYQEISGNVVPTLSSALAAMAGPLTESLYYGIVVLALFLQKYSSRPGIHQWRVFSLDWTGIGLALSTIHSISYGISICQENLDYSSHFGNDFVVIREGAGPAASALVVTIYCTSALVLLCLCVHRVFSSAIQTPCNSGIWV